MVQNANKYCLAIIGPGSYDDGYFNWSGLVIIENKIIAWEILIVMEY